jgi:hypothetical protein
MHLARQCAGGARGLRGRRRGRTCPGRGHSRRTLRGRVSRHTHGDETRDSGERTERLLNLLSRSDEAEIDERGDGNARDRVPFELADELERQEREVDPDSAALW